MRVARLGDGVGRAFRQAGELDALIALEVEFERLGRAFRRGGLAQSAALLRYRRGVAADEVDVLRRGQFHLDVVAFLHVRIARVRARAFQLLGDGQVADVALVGEGRGEGGPFVRAFLDFDDARGGTGLDRAHSGHVALGGVVRLGHGVGRALGDALDGEGLAVLQLDDAGRRAVRDRQGARLGGRAFVGGGGEGGIVVVIDIRAVLVLLEGEREVKCAVLFPAGAGDGLADDQIAGIADVGVGHLAFLGRGDRVGHREAGVVVGDIHAVDLRDIAFLAVVLLGHGVGRAFQQAGEGDGLAAFEGEGLCPRLAGDVVGDRRAVLRARVAAIERGFHTLDSRGREGDGDVKRLVRIRVVALDGLADGQLAGLAGVGEDHFGGAALRDHTLGVFGSSGHVAFRAVVVLGHGVLRVRRDAGEDFLFAAFEGEGAHRGVGRAFLIVGGVFELHAAVDVVHRQLGVFEGDGEGEVLGLIPAGAVDLLCDGQAAGVAGVGEDHLGLFVPRDHAGGVAGVRGGKAFPAVVVLGHDVGRAHGEAGEGHFLQILELEGVDAGGFLHEINGPVVLLEGLAREGLAIRVLQRQRESEGLVVPVIIAHDELLEGQAAGEAVGEGDQGLLIRALMDDAVAAVIHHGGDLVRSLHDRGVGGELASAILVREVHFDGVDAGIVLNVFLRTCVLLEFVGVGSVLARFLHVVVAERERAEGEVTTGVGLSRRRVFRGVLARRVQLEGVAGQGVIALHDLLAVDGQRALGNVLVGDGHGALDRAGHVRASVGFEHEVVGVLLFIEAGHFDVRFPAYDAVDAGVVVAAFGVVLGDHVVGVGVEEFAVARRERLAGFDGLNEVFAGHGDNILRVVRAVVRAVHTELDVGNGLAVGGGLVDGQVAHADDADVVGVVHAVFAAARRDVELDGLAGEGKVAVGVRALFDRGLAGRGDAVASRDRDRELVGRAGAAHEAGVVDIAAGEVLCIAALRRGGVEALEDVIAVLVRRRALRLLRVILHVGLEVEGGRAAGHLGLAFILDAVHVLVDPDAVAEVNGFRHDGDLGVRAGQRGGRTFVVHAGGGVDRQLIVVVILRIRGRGGGVGQRYRLALLQLLDLGEEGVGAFEVARVRADAVGKRVRALGRTFLRVVDGARAGNSARERRAPRAAAIAIVGKHIEDAQVRNSSTAVVGDGHAVVDGFALLGDQQRFVAVPSLAIDADQLVDGDAGRAGHGVRGLGSEGHAAAALGEGGEALRHGNARQRAALIREGGAMLVVHALGHGMLVEDIGRVRKGRAVDERRRGDVGENGEGQRIALGKLARGGDPDILTSLLRAGDLERCGIRLSLDAAFHRGEAGGQDVREDGVFHSFLGHTGEGDGVEEALAGGDGLALDLLAQSVLHLRGLLDGDLRQSRLVLDGGAGGGGIFLRPGRGGIGSAHGAKVVGHFDGGGVADRLDRDGGPDIVRLTGLDVEDDGIGLEAGVEGGFFIAVAVNDLDAIAGVRCERDGLCAGEAVLAVLAPFAVRGVLGEEVGVDGVGGGRIVVSGRLVVRRADDDALDIPLDAGHVLAVRVLEGEGFIREGRVFQRQHGVGGEAAEGELDGLIFIAQQVAFAEVFRLLLDIDIEFLRVGQVGKHHHGDAAIVADLDTLLRAPNLARGVRGVEVAGGLSGLGDGVGTLGYVFDVVEGVGNAVLFVVVALGIIASELPTGGRAFAAGLKGHRAYSLKGRLPGQGGVVEIVVFEDGDLAKRGIVGVEVNVRVRGHGEEAVLTGDLPGRGGGIGDVVELQRAFLKAVGRIGLPDGVVLAIRELREVVEADGAGAVRAGGLAQGRKGSVLRAVFVHAVERELRAIERAAAFRHAEGLVVLGQGDDDALLVDDGVRKGRGLACRERDKGVRRGRVACGGLGLLHVEGIVRHGAVDDAVGQLDVCEGDRAVHDGSGLRRVIDAGAPLLGLRVPVELRIAHLIIEGKFRARQRAGGGGVALRAFLGEGEARDVADVGEVDRGGVAGGDFHHGGGAVVAAQPGEGGRVLRQDVLGVPVGSARSGLLDVVGAGIEREGRVSVGDADALARFGDGSRARAGDGEGADLAVLGAILVRVDIEGNGLAFEAGHVLIRLGDVEVALAGVDDGDFGAAGGVALAHGRAEVVRGDFDDHVFRQHVIFVGVAFHLVQPVPAGDEAVGAAENDHAVFARGEQRTGDGHAGQGRHIAGDLIGLRRGGRVVVILGESLEVQLELHAFQGLFLIIRLEDGEDALAGVFEVEFLRRIGRGDGEGGVVVDDGEVGLLRFAQLHAADMRLRDGVGAGGEVEFRLAVGAGGDGIDGRLYELASIVHQPDIDGRAVLVDLEGGGNGVVIAVYLDQRDLAVEDVFNGDNGFLLRRRAVAVIGRGEEVLRRRDGLVAGGRGDLLPVVGLDRVKGEVDQAVLASGAAGDFILACLVGVDADHRARQRLGRIRLIAQIVTDLLDGHGDLVAERVDDGVFAGIAIVERGIGLRIRVVCTVGDDVQRIGVARRGGVERPGGLDEDEVGLVFAVLDLIRVALVGDVLDVIAILFVQLVHLDGLGHAAAGHVFLALAVVAIRQVNAGGELGHALEALGVGGVRQPELEGGVGQVFIAFLGTGDLVHHHLQVADAARAMLGMVLHAAGGGLVVLVGDLVAIHRGIGHEDRADAIGICGGDEARRGLKLVEPVDVAAFERAGDDRAGAGAVGNAGLVDVIADAIVRHAFFAANELGDAAARVIILFERAAVEVELGAVERLLVLLFIVYPNGFLVCADVLFRLIPLLQRELHIGLDVEQLGLSRVVGLAHEKHRYAVVLGQRILCGHLLQRFHAAGEGLFPFSEQFQGVAELKDIVGLGAIEPFEGERAVFVGL